MLHIDTREPTSYHALLESTLSGRVNAIMLDSADYLIFDTDGCAFGLERKTWSDLLHSLGHTRESDGIVRLVSQCQRMSETYTHNALILEGEMSMTKEGKITTRSKTTGKYQTTGWSHASVQMYLLKLQMVYNTKVFYTPTMSSVLDLLRILEERAEKGCIFPRKAVAPSDQYQAPNDEKLNPEGFLRSVSSHRRQSGIRPSQDRPVEAVWRNGPPVSVSISDAAVELARNPARVGHLLGTPTTESQGGR